MQIRNKIKRISTAALALAVVAQPAFAQDLFAAPTSILGDIQAFVLGAPGVLLGGAAIAAAGISAAAPRIPVTWGQFFVLLVVLGIFYGAFGLAATIQGLAA